MSETFVCKDCEIEQDKAREVKTRYPTRICIDCWGFRTSTGKQEQKAKRVEEVSRGTSEVAA